jgi:hypothetical protein
LAQLHDSFLEAGVRIFAISIDSPGRNAAMVEKLDLPFPLLSDPDRSRAIEPFGVSDTRDDRNLATPAMILLAPGGEELWRFVSRDFADRFPEDEVLSRARSLGLEAAVQLAPDPGQPEPGPRAMPLDGLPVYLRGARFAALAMGLRHGHFDDSIKQDSKAYVAEMDRYLEAVRELRSRKSAG